MNPPGEDYGLADMRGAQFVAMMRTIHFRNERI
jgi:hypothetical protein